MLQALFVGAPAAPLRRCVTIPWWPTRASCAGHVLQQRGCDGTPRCVRPAGWPGRSFCARRDGSLAGLKLQLLPRQGALAGGAEGLDVADQAPLGIPCQSCALCRHAALDDAWRARRLASAGGWRRCMGEPSPDRPHCQVTRQRPKALRPLLLGRIASHRIAAPGASARPPTIGRRT